jgi:branched-chain amino acid transport system ATP-binding protein
MSADQPPVLSVDDLMVELAGIQIVHGVSLQLAAGELLVVIGPNGAGKTTLLRTISGLIRPRRGHVRFQGRDITGARPHRVARQGIQHVQEGKRIFKPLSVETNLRIGALAGRGRIREARAREAQERVFTLFPRLAERRHQAAGSLSGGEQQMLAIGQALMNSPRVLMLDEPSAGLAPVLVERMFEVLRELRSGGSTILLVEQLLEQSLAIADRACLLSGGRIVATGDAAEIRTRTDLKQLYFGGTVPVTTGETVS